MLKINSLQGVRFRLPAVYLTKLNINMAAV
jgi:hypothetical protein